MALAEVFYTKEHTPYLKSPGVVLHNQTAYEGDSYKMKQALEEQDYDWSEYCDERYVNELEQTIKHAGQACYQSYGPRRTHNTATAKYLDNIISSGHGSVLEHATVGFYVYGISRACSHELVRHRVGTAFSQVSQRYVDASHLRFVMRPEFEFWHVPWETYIDDVAKQYVAIQSILRAQLVNEDFTATEQRKRAQQAARDVLPNCTETQMILTANARTWRHFLVMRADPQADTAIRMLAIEIYHELLPLLPNVLADFEEHTSDIDGKPFLTSRYGSI